MLLLLHQFPRSNKQRGRKEGRNRVVSSIFCGQIMENLAIPPLHALRDRENKRKVDEATTRRIRVLLVERTGKTQRGKGALLTQRGKEAKLAGGGAKPEEEPEERACLVEKDSILGEGESNLLWNFNIPSNILITRERKKATPILEFRLLFPLDQWFSIHKNSSRNF